MTIDVLIPSYNRAKFIVPQLATLERIKDALSPSVRLRVIISDNHSNPEIEIPTHMANFVVVVKPPQHLSTAEENVFWGIQQCSAEYIWLLGDDDVPIISNTIQIFEKIKREQPHFAFCNSSGVMVDGSFIASRTSCSNSSHIKSMPDFVQRTGFTFAIANFSCIVMKTDLLHANLDGFKKYFETSKIYSLVFWLSETYWNSTFTYFNEPLVIYRQNMTDLNSKHWPQVAKKEGVFQLFFWTLGLVRLFKLLRKSRSVELGFFSTILDQDWNGRHLLINHCLKAFLDQTEKDLSSNTHTQGRPATHEEKNEFINFMIREDERHIDYYVAMASKEIKSEDVRFLQKQLLNLQFYDAFFIKEIAGWNIYNFDKIYRALPASCASHFRMELNDIAPISSEWQITGNDLKEVELAVQARPYPLSKNHMKNINQNEIRDLKFIAGFARTIFELMPGFIRRIIKRVQ